MQILEVQENAHNPPQVHVRVRTHVIAPAGMPRWLWSVGGLGGDDLGPGGPANGRTAGLGSGTRRRTAPTAAARQAAAASIRAPPQIHTPAQQCLPGPIPADWASAEPPLPRKERTAACCSSQWIVEQRFSPGSHPQYDVRSG